MKVFKKPLTQAQANACENAVWPRCTCRCGGALHGKAHKMFSEMQKAVIAEQGGITDEQLLDIATLCRREA